MELYLNKVERVISCPRNIQWIYQKRKEPRWVSLAYCSTRDVLISEILSQTRSEGLERGAMKALLNLPDNIIHTKRKNES